MAQVLVMLMPLLVGGLLASPANYEKLHRHFHSPPSPAPPAAAASSSLQLNRISMLPYYLQNPEQVNYYSQEPVEKLNSAPPPPSSRIETLEPDSEVEILPGAQPQQPPQQNPVQPNLPGLIPGQRVFIVHMPVPGYRPGTVGGYQPVYVVAAAPNGNTNYNNYANNGYQNPLVDPSGHPSYAFQQNVNPGYLIFSPVPAHLAPAAQFAIASRPYDSVHQQHYTGFNGVVGAVPIPASSSEGAQPLRMSQLIGLYPPQIRVDSNLQKQEKDSGDANLRSSRLMHSTDSIEIQEGNEDMANVRPTTKQNKQ